MDWGTVEPVDVLCGGFPCQDISLAGKGAGLSGARSGLWSEYVKAIDALKPKYILIENVAALRSRGLDQVLREIAAIGYDAEWHCIPASAVGAPHRRDRVWIVAYPIGSRQLQPQGMQPDERGWAGNESQEQYERVMREWDGFEGERTDNVADADRERLFQCEPEGQQEAGVSVEDERCGADSMADALSANDRGAKGSWRREWEQGEIGSGGLAKDGYWAVEPTVGRVAHGVPNRVDSLRGLGNAIVPQIAEALGRMILSIDSARGSGGLTTQQEEV